MLNVEELTILRYRSDSQLRKPLPYPTLTAKTTHQTRCGWGQGRARSSGRRRDRGGPISWPWFRHCYCQGL